MKKNIMVNYKRLTDLSVLFVCMILVCLSFIGCATTRVTKIDFNYFEKYRQQGHRLVYIASETGGFIPRGDLYVITNPDDIELLKKSWGMITELSPVYIPNHKTDGGKGLAVFSLPKEENNIQIRFHGVGNNYGSITQINHNGICTIPKDVDDVFISVSLGLNNAKNLTITYLQWYDQEKIYQEYISCTGKYGYYEDNNKKEQLAFIKIK